MTAELVLFESASGYALFEKIEAEEIAEQALQYQQSLQDFDRFKRCVRLKAFSPFTSAENALENLNDVSEGVLNNHLKTFLQQNVGKNNVKLGLSEEKLGSAISDELGLQCVKNTAVLEMMRCLRLHFAKFIKELKSGDLDKAQLGLGHSYSRAKVKFNVHKADNMIIQSISMLDQLDKDLNTFAMRCREWYSWHFPELGKIVTEHAQYARLVKLIGNKESLTEELLPQVAEILNDEDKAKDLRRC